jgi:hypothetical protein
MAIGVEVRSQLETEGADREKIEAKQSLLKKFCSGRRTFKKLTPDAATILSQLARQAQKIKS